MEFTFSGRGFFTCIVCFLRLIRSAMLKGTVGYIVITSRSERLKLQEKLVPLTDYCPGPHTG